MNETFGVIGGDRRQAELVRLLEQAGRPVYSAGTEWDAALDRAAAADVVLLPLPLCREPGVLNGTRISTAELFRTFRPDQLVLAGRVEPQQQEEAESCGVHLVDYFLREELKVANAAATAEAALQVAMEQSDRTLSGRNCLVLGFGRIGKILCCRLRGLRARVTAVARNPADRAWAKAYGYDALAFQDLSGRLRSFPVVFNTVPALILEEPLLVQLPKHCLLLDLASVPGLDQAAADQCGLHSVWARSLPGRLVPCTAAEAIRDTVEQILREREEDR